MNRENIRTPERSIANLEFQHTTDEINEVARKIVAAVERSGVRAVNGGTAGFPMEADRWGAKMWVISHKPVAIAADLGHIKATMVIRNRTLEVSEGHTGTPNLRMTPDSQTWLRFLRKEGNLVWALLRRKIRIHGSPRLLLAFGPLLLILVSGAANGFVVALERRQLTSRKGEEKMEYLVQMKLAAYGRPTTPHEGAAFIEDYILPSLAICKKLQEEKKILAGGPMSGIIGIAMILQADSAQELDELIDNLPIWPRMETTVTPLTTFDGRIVAIRPRLEHLKTRLHNGPTASR